MNTYADKIQGAKNQSVASTFSQKQSSGDSSFQFADNRPEATAQRKLRDIANNQQPIQTKPNQTGLPDNLKTGVENLSGYSMDDVKVHYNSPKPATLQAHAYAQGTDIHLGPGQERHLPHEAWHVVQQKQGRVRPTMQLKGTVNINDDAGLEKEADVMGARAFSTEEVVQARLKGLNVNHTNGNSLQLAQLYSYKSLVVQREIRGEALNMVGESHDKTDRVKEKEYLEKKYGISPQNYWTEFEFKIQEKNYKNVQKHADPPIAHVREQILGLVHGMQGVQDQVGLYNNITEKVVRYNVLIGKYWNSAYYGFISLFSPDASSEDKKKVQEFALEKNEEARMLDALKIAKTAEFEILQLYGWIKGDDFFLTKQRRMNAISKLAGELELKLLLIDSKMSGLGSNAPNIDSRETALTDERNSAMVYGAWQAGLSGKTGVWKVGNEHIKGILPLKDGFLLRGSNVTLTTKDEFDIELNQEGL